MKEIQEGNTNYFINGSDEPRGRTGIKTQT